MQLQKTNIVMGKVKLSNITETNNLICCGAALVTETLRIDRDLLLLLSAAPD